MNVAGAWVRCEGLRPRRAPLTPGCRQRGEAVPLRVEMLGCAGCPCWHREAHLCFRTVPAAVPGTSEALKPAGLSAGSALHHTSRGFSQPAQTAGAWVAAVLLLPVPAPGGSASHAQTAALAGENGFAAIVPQGVLLDPADAFCWLLSGSLWGASETTPKSALELSPGVCPRPKAAQSLTGVELCSLGSRSPWQQGEGDFGQNYCSHGVGATTRQVPHPHPTKSLIFPDHPAPSSISVGWFFQHCKKKR